MMLTSETKHKHATWKSFFGVCDCVQVHHHGERQQLVINSCRSRVVPFDITTVHYELGASSRLATGLEFPPQMSEASGGTALIGLCVCPVLIGLS